MLMNVAILELLDICAFPDVFRYCSDVGCVIQKMFGDQAPLMSTGHKSCKLWNRQVGDVTERGPSNSRTSCAVLMCP